jgi:tetratricopeptide (TPR) repeat protein
MQCPASRSVLPRLLVALLMSLGLATARAQDTGDDADTEDEAPSAAASAPALPNEDLTPQILYQLLLSEIAGARGKLDVSVQGYLDLAKQTRDPRIAKRATEVALYARRAPEALEAARLWTSVDPNSEAAIQTLAGLLAGGMGKIEELEPQLARLLARHKDGPASLLMGLNRTLARYPDKAEVRKTVDRLTEPYLKIPEARFARAHAAFNAGDSAGALVELDQALVDRPDWEPAALLKAQLLQQDGRTDEAIAFLKDFTAKRPAARDARYTYARLLAADRQYPAARAEFEKLVQEMPENTEIGFTYGLLLIQAGEKAAAEAEFKRVLALGRPDQDQVRLQLGQLYEDQKRTAEAIDMYRSVTGSQRTTGYARAAMLQARSGDLPGARAEFKRLRDENPKDAVIYLLAEGQILRELNHVQEAFDLLGGELNKDPNQPEVLYDYSLLAERLDKLDVMEKSLRKLIVLKPDEAQAYNALGYSLADRNQRLDEAKQLISKALELQPDDGFILDSMGWVLYRKGDLTGARDNLQRAFAQRPDPEIAAHLGEVLWMMGQKNDARSLWNESLRQHPENEELAKVMKRFAE